MENESSGKDNTSVTSKIYFWWNFGQRRLTVGYYVNKQSFFRLWKREKKRKSGNCSVLVVHVNGTQHNHWPGMAIG